MHEDSDERVETFKQFKQDEGKAKAKANFTCRQIAIDLEELENVRPIRPDNLKDIENFADLLAIAVINFYKASGSAELGNGSLYLKLQRKVTELYARTIPSMCLRGF